MAPGAGLVTDSLFVVGCITVDCIVVSPTVLMLPLVTGDGIGFFLAGI